MKHVANIPWPVAHSLLIGYEPPEQGQRRLIGWHKGRHRLYLAYALDHAKGRTRDGYRLECETLEPRCWGSAFGIDASGRRVPRAEYREMWAPVPA